MAIRFYTNEHAKRTQVRSGLQLAFVSMQNEFAGSFKITFWRYQPQDKSIESGTERFGRGYVVQSRDNDGCFTFTHDIDFPFAVWHSCRRPELDGSIKPWI